MGERGELRVDATGNSSGFNQMLRGMEMRVNQFAGKMGDSWSAGIKGLAGGFLGMLSFDSIKGFIMGTVEAAEHLKDITEQFDVSAESAQKWAKALARAGISENVYYGSLERIRANREAALSGDEKMQRKFRGAGLDYSTDADTLLEQLLRSDASRPAIKDLAGKSAPRLRAALPFLANAKADYSNADLEAVEEMRQTMKAPTNKLRALMLKTVRMFWTQFQYGTSAEETGQFVAAQDYLSKRQAQIDDEQRKQEERAAADSVRAQDVRTKAADESIKVATEQYAAEERLRIARRRNMTRGERRADLENEAKELEARQKFYENMQDLAGPDWMAKALEAKAKREGVMSELREKPLSLGADQMAKSGLFSASAANFSMEAGTQRAQLEVLRVIARNTANSHNPWSY